MTEIEKILESTNYVVDNSQHVRINKDNIKQFCQNVKIDNILSNWLENTPFNLEIMDEREKSQFVLVFNALSFSYWGNPYWQVTYQGQTFYRGSWSLVAAILRAREEGFPILEADYQSSISSDDLNIILRGNRQIPLLKERLNILHDVGISLKKKYDGCYRNVINAANDDAVSLLDIIIAEFPSFSDTSCYKGKVIYFQKRAQALIQSTHYFIKELENVNRLTALADYILPKKLREEKILEYDSELSYKVDNKVQLKRGSQSEVEIRANTIWAVKYIVNGLDNKNIKATPMQINDYLWLTGGEKDTPFHLTRTTGY